MSTDIISKNSNPVFAYEAEEYYKFNLLAPNWIATSGIMNFCRQNKSFWVLDVITSYLPSLHRLAKFGNLDYMLIIEVKVKNSKATFTIFQQPDEERKIVIKQNIPYTNLNENLIFWAINETDKYPSYDPTGTTVLMLPSEY